MDDIIKNIDEILVLTRENNIMLKAIIEYISNNIANADEENANDFIRNIIANMISNGGKI